MSFEIVSVEPLHATPRYSPRRPLALRFNAPVDGSTCAAAIGLIRHADWRLGLRRWLGLRFELRDGGTRIRVHADGIRRGEVYLLRIGPELRAADGAQLAGGPPNPYPRGGGAHAVLFATSAGRALQRALTADRSARQPALIDANTADVASLLPLRGIGPVKAAALLARRQEAGGYAEVADLIDVRGIGPATLADIRGETAALGSGEAAAGVHVTRGRMIEALAVDRERTEWREQMDDDVIAGAWAGGSDRVYYLIHAGEEFAVEAVGLSRPVKLGRWQVPPASDLVVARRSDAVVLRGADGGDEIVAILDPRGGSPLLRHRVQVTPFSADRAGRGARPLCLSQAEDEIWIAGRHGAGSAVVAIDPGSGEERGRAVVAGVQIHGLFPHRQSGLVWCWGTHDGGGALVAIAPVSGEEHARWTRPRVPTAVAPLPGGGEAYVAYAGVPAEVVRLDLAGGGETRIGRARGRIEALRSDPVTGRLFATIEFHRARTVVELTGGRRQAVALGADVGDVVPVGLDVTWPVNQRTRLAIYNPTNRSAEARVTLIHEGGGQASFAPVEVRVPAHARATVDLDEHLVAPGGYACTVTSQSPLAAERLATWQDGPEPAGDFSPAVAPSESWTFAEGFHHAAFRNALVLYNPGRDESRVTVNLLVDRPIVIEGWPIELSLRGGERRHLDLEARLPAGEHGFGLSIAASKPIVAERSMIRGGGLAQLSPGQSATSTSHFFAGGTTRDGAATFLLAAAPGNAAVAQVVLRDAAGQPLVSPAGLTLDVPARGRATMSFDQSLVPAGDFSIEIHSNEPIATEVAVYQARQAGHAVPGLAAGRREWLFPAGADRGDRAFLRLFNPGEAAVTAKVSLRDAAGHELAGPGPTGPRAPLAVEVDPRALVVIDLRAHHAAGAPAYAIEVDAPAPLVAERTLHADGGRVEAASAGALRGTHVHIAGGSHVPAPGLDRRIDLNTATVKRLRTLPRIENHLARAIVAWRRAHGPFRDPLDLVKVPGIGMEIYRTVRGLVRVDRSTSPIDVNIDGGSNVTTTAPPAAIPSGFLDSLEDDALQAGGAPLGDVLARMRDHVDPITGGLTHHSIEVQLPGRGGLDFALTRLYSTDLVLAGWCFPRINAEHHRRLLLVRGALDFALAHGRSLIADARAQLDREMAEVLADVERAMNQAFDDAIDEAVRDMRNDLANQLQELIDEARDELEAELDEAREGLDELEGEEPDEGDYIEEGMTQEEIDQAMEDFEADHDQWEEDLADAEDAVSEMEDELADLEADADVTGSLDEAEDSLRDGAEEMRAEVLQSAREEFHEEFDAKVAEVRAELETSAAELEQNFQRGQVNVARGLARDPATRAPLPTPLGVGWTFDLPRYHQGLGVLQVGAAFFDVRWDGDLFAPPGKRLSMRRVDLEVPGIDGAARRARFELEDGRISYLDGDGLPLAQTDRARRSWILFGWAAGGDAGARLVAVRGAAGDLVELHYDGALVSRITATAGREQRFAYSTAPDPADRLLMETSDSIGRRTGYRYDEPVTVQARGFSLATRALTAVDLPGGGLHGYSYENNPVVDAPTLPVVIGDGVEMRIEDDPVAIQGRLRVETRYDRGRNGETARETGYVHDDDEQHVRRQTVSSSLKSTTTIYRARLDAGGKPTRWFIAEVTIVAKMLEAPGRPADIRRAYEVDSLGNPLVVREWRLDVPAQVMTFDYTGEQARWGRPSRVRVQSPDGEVLREIRYRYHATYVDQVEEIAGDVATPMRWRFDEDGRDPAGTGHPTSIVVVADGRELVTTLRWDEAGNPIEIVEADGRRQTYVWEARNGISGAALRERIDGDNRRSWRYDRAPATGWILARHAPDGTIRRYERDPLGRINAITDPIGRRTGWAYLDAEARVVVTLPDGRRFDTQSDGVGRILSRTQLAAPVGGAVPPPRVTRYEHDADGRVSATIDPTGAATRVEYDFLDRPLRMVLADGNEETWFYDDRHLPRPVGDRVVTGTIARRHDAEGGSAGFIYDYLAQAVVSGRKIAEDTRQFAFREYDRAGRVVTDIDRLGAVTRYRYDDLGRLTAVVLPTGGEDRWTFHNSGAIASQTDADGITWRYEIDDLGRRISQTGPTGFARRLVLDAMDRSVEETDAAGAVTRTTWDAAGRVTARTDAAGGRWSFAYDAGDRLVAITDPLGAVTRMAYDGFGDVVATTDPLGATSRIERDLAGRPIAHIDATGARWSHQLDVLGRRAATTDPLGRTVRQTWDRAGRLATFEGIGGARVSYERDDAGRVLREIGPGTLATSFEWDAADRVVATTDADGLTQRTRHDAGGRVVETAAPLDGFFAFGYTPAGRPVSVRDGSGAEARLEYDAGGRLAVMTDPGGATERFAYDPVGRLMARNHAGAVWHYQHDGRGLLTSMTDPAGVTTTYTYDAAGRMIAAAAGDAVARSEWDAAGRLAAQVDEVGARTTYLRDARGLVTSARDAAGEEWRTTRDVLGRVVERRDPIGRRRRWSFSADERTIEMRDEVERVSVMTLDEARRWVERRDPLGGVTRATYTAAGRPTAVTDPNGSVWRIEYDAAGRMSAAVTPDGGRHTLAYEPRGLIARAQEQGGSPLVYSYDSTGRLRTIAVEGAGTSLATFTYDARGALIGAGPGAAITLRRDAAGRVVETTRGGSDRVLYAYDDRGRLGSIERDGVAVSYGYDPANRLTRVEQAGVVVELERDPLGRIVLRRASGGFAERRDYGPAGRLHRITGGRDGATPTFLLQLGYDPAGNVATVLREDDAEPTQYTYDALDRVVLIRAPGAANRGFGYDAAGNRLVEFVGGRAQRQYEYDGAHRMTRVTFADGSAHPIGADGVGRMLAFPDGNDRLWDLRWGSRGELLDARERGAGGRVVQWIRDPLLAVSERRSGANGERFLEADGGLVAVDAAGPAVAFAPQDELDHHAIETVAGVSRLPIQALDGTILARHAPDGERVQTRRFDAFGVPIRSDGEASPAPVGFAGRAACPDTGVVDLRNRPYAPTLGRFLAPDPLFTSRAARGLTGRFAYAANNPLGNRDPFGLQERSLVDEADIVGDNFTSDVTAEAPEEIEKFGDIQCDEAAAECWGFIAAIRGELYVDNVLRDALSRFETDFNLDAAISGRLEQSLSNLAENFAAAVQSDLATLSNAISGVQGLQSIGSAVSGLAGVIANGGANLVGALTGGGSGGRGPGGTGGASGDVPTAGTGFDPGGPAAGQDPGNPNGPAPSGGRGFGGTIGAGTGYESTGSGTGTRVMEDVSPALHTVRTGALPTAATTQIAAARRQAINAPRNFRPGQLLDEQYNLWSGINTGGFDSAARDHGFVMGDTVFEEAAEAKAVQLGYPSRYATMSQADFEAVWHPPSDKLAIRAGLSQIPVRSHGLSTHPAPAGTVQVMREIPRVVGAGAAMALAGKIGGICTVISAMQADSAWVRGVGAIAGAFEIIGSTIYLYGVSLLGASAVSSTLMRAGATITGAAGGVATAVLSGYHAYQAYQEGDYLTAAFDFLGAVGGAALFVGAIFSAPAWLSVGAGLTVLALGYHIGHGLGGWMGWH